MRMSAHFWNSSKSVTKVLVLTTSAHVAETAVEVLERLFHLRPHVAFADAVAVDVAGQLAGGVDDLAAAAHVTTCEYDGFPPDILTFMPSG